jgi:hypothetical protein
MSRPGIEPGPPAREASTLEKSHLDSLFAGYSEPLLGLRWRSARGLYIILYFHSRNRYSSGKLVPYSSIVSTSSLRSVMLKNKLFVD